MVVLHPFCLLHTLLSFLLHIGLVMLDTTFPMGEDGHGLSRQFVGHGVSAKSSNYPHNHKFKEIGSIIDGFS